ncbi:MlaD family protein [Rubrivirga sp. IMCC43871]|uniref:MlaD family protein n=1 Tax=Rubrivirga sp. IMCC43871 TaxID=3391575 RepID=UPI0039902D88
MSRQARLGLVILLAIFSAIGVMFVIGSQNSLFASTFAVRASFDRVAGLQPGASVFYNGISVGRVNRVQLPAEPGAPIMVFMAIDEEARPLIREDSRALIQTDGLVGSVIVSLTDGSANRPQVADNGQIEGVNPFALAEVSERLFESVARFDSVTVGLSQTLADVRTGQGTLGRFLYDETLYESSVATADAFAGTVTEAQQTLRSFTARADQLVAVAENASRGVDEILTRVYTGEGTVAKFLNEPAVYETFLATAAQLQEGAGQLQTVSSDIRAITDRLNQAAGWGALATFRAAELMEAGKHNFLFRGYFEDRGYYEMAPFEVREAAISETLADLQEWERRLVDQERQLEEARAEMARIRAEVEAAGGSRPPDSAPNR